jgi:small-conductance mechanosensitive channel
VIASWGWVALLAAGGTAHWLLRRVRLRLPRLLARRWAARGGSGPVPGVRTVTIATTLAQLALWLAVAEALSDEFALLASIRSALAGAVVMSVEAPLFTMNERSYTAIDLLVLPGLIALVYVVSGALARFVRAHLLAAATGDVGAQEAMATILRLLVAFVGLLVVLQAWGVDVRSLAIVASVLGVGIGFGLQHLANNFVSGLVLALERPVRTGDFVRVGEFLGTVQHIGARSTAVQTLENVTILVPNSKLLEQEVVNWSYGSPVSKLGLPVAVAYGSDLRAVRAALLEAAREQASVLREPRPEVDFRAFGADGVELELEVWTAEPHQQRQILSDLGFRVEALFRRDGVAVPFPQRDLHVRSPELSRLALALERQLGVEPVAPPPAVASPPSATADGTPGLPDDDPRRWPDDALARLAARMQAPGGVPVADRRHLLTVYPGCFVGSEAVEWMTREAALSRTEAIVLGERLVERGLVRHVLDEHGFRDGWFFYRFVPQPASASVRKVTSVS